MIKYIKTLLLFTIGLSSTHAQQLGEFFELKEFTYHEGLDSIVSTSYMIDEYADGEPDLSIEYDSSNYDLHYFEKTVLVYTDKLSYESNTIHKHLGLKNSLQVKFNDNGKPIYLKTSKASSEMFDEEKSFEYDDKGRLITRTRTGYNVMEYEKGNTEITTDTTMKMVYAENNLIASAQSSMAAGIAIVIKPENVGDTLRYMGEMKMTGFASDMMDAAKMDKKKQAKKKVMDVIYNKDTEMYQSFEKQRGGTIRKQIIDKQGRTVELIVMMNDVVQKHEKYSYDGYDLVGIESMVDKQADAGSDEIEYNDKGQKISMTTYKGVFKYEYDDKGNLTKEINLNPYNNGLENYTVHTYYFSK